jgi:hypothetical protein
MKTRNRTVVGALLVAMLLASQGAFAQGGGGGTSGGSGAGQANGMNNTNSSANSDQNRGAGAAGSKSGGGTLMQKREQGMSADRPASSPQSTGKMSQ